MTEARIVIQWNDCEACYVYALQKSRIGVGFWPWSKSEIYWDTITYTSTRQYAERWANHYKIHLPELPK